MKFTSDNNLTPIGLRLKNTLISISTFGRALYDRWFKKSNPPSSSRKDEGQSPARFRSFEERSKL